MRIALTVDPELPVPPTQYGGIERVVDLLARELVRMGHEVTLFANPASTCQVEVRGWPGSASNSKLDTLRNARFLANALTAENFDIVHSHSRLAYLLPVMPLPIPKLMTYHRHVSRRTTRAMHALSRGTLEFSAVGKWMVSADLPGNWHAVANCVPLSCYTYRSEVDDDAPLVFLGRVEEIKGPHIAIAVARKSARKLIIAGNVPLQHEAWFEQNIKPHLDGEQIRFVGPVNDAQKNELLGSAAALLMPIQWEEPFGMVMAEAMACGTPVIALRRGAAAEIVVHGVTGFVADSVEQMVTDVDHIGAILRSSCRARVEALYSESAVASAYCKIYRGLIDRVRSSRSVRVARR